MKADVIDLDTLQTGENRAALFFSAWSFAQKATASIGGAWGENTGLQSKMKREKIWAVTFSYIDPRGSKNGRRPFFICSPLFLYDLEKNA